MREETLADNDVGLKYTGERKRSAWVKTTSIWTKSRKYVAITHAMSPAPKANEQSRI